jgi:hypothetical protein
VRCQLRPGDSANLLTLTGVGLHYARTSRKAINHRSQAIVLRADNLIIGWGPCVEIYRTRRYR